MAGDKPQGDKDEQKKPEKPKTMDELRRPGISNLPPTDEEFEIASPGTHVPEGQDTHE
jgi:hypothetical protein